MSIRKTASLSAFLLLTWLVIMLFNIWIHELGHALAFRVSQGWHNSIVSFGSTFPTDPAFMQEVVAQLQSSGLTPEIFTAADQMQLLESLGRNLPSIRLGVLGGWLGQLVVTLLIFLLTRTKAFQKTSSGYGRLFWHGYILINLAWMGGNWLFMGLSAPASSDPIVLINVILQKNAAAIGILWLLAVGLIGLAILLARSYGDQLFSLLGLSSSQSRRLAFLWVVTTSLAGILLKLPGTTLPVLLILLVILASPIYFFRRLPLAETQWVTVPALAWQTTLVIFGLMLAFIFTNTGIVAFALDGNAQQLNVLSTIYCEQTSCLPSEIKAWFLP